MQLRLETLRREQERLIVEMERAIYKHEAVAIRSKPKPTNPHLKNAAPEYSNLGLRKRIIQLKNGLRGASKESAEYTLNLEDRQLKLQALTADLEKVRLWVY
jgi:hypothetical protein